MNGAEFSCGPSQSGAGPVIVDINVVRSRLTPARSGAGRQVMTPQGLGINDNSFPLQKAFIVERVARCGTCIDVMIMSVTAMLKSHAGPYCGEISASASSCGESHRWRQQLAPLET